MVDLVGSLSYNQQLELIYIAYFNRAGDANGFNFWSGQNSQAQAAGQSADDSLKNIANSFTPQPETYALYPFLSTPNLNLATAASQTALTSVVNAIYLNLFDRAADAAGLSYWVSNLTSGAIPIGEAVLFIANGAIGADAITIQNKVSVALDFTNRTETQYQASVSPPAAYLASAKSVLSGVDGVAVNDASVTAGILATSQFLNTPPTISGTVANQQISDSATVTPFPGVSIADPDTGATETVTITLTANGTASDANGVLTGAGLTHSGAGTYVLAAGTPTAVTSILHALVFTPTLHEVAAGAAATTGLTLSVSDGIATATTNSTTTIVATRPAATATTTALTLNQDTVTGSGAGGDVINAPVAFVNGTATQQTTLQAGDTITETGLNNTLNLTVGVNDKSISGAIISGVQTLNVTNLGFAGTPPLLAGNGITGLTTVNDVNSTQAVSVGSAAAPLSAALSNVGISSTTSTSNLTNLLVYEAAAALAGSSDALTVTVLNAGSSTVTDEVLVGPATGTNGYETINVSATGANFIGIGNPIAGANSVTAVTVTGSGALSLFGDGLGNDFTKLTTINASAATGAVTITGLSSSGAGTGLLSGDTSLKSVLGGSGNDSVDISVLTPALLNANGTTVDLGAGRNTLIVSDAVATSTSISSVANVQILGDSNPGAIGGTTDLSKLPSSIDTFQFFGSQVGAVTLVNAPTSFTFNQSTFGSTAPGTVNLSATGSGLSDTLAITTGSATAGNNTDEYYNTSGYETVTIQAQGGATQKDVLFQIIAAASAGGAENLNITGSAALTILGPTTGSAVVLKGNATTITDTDTGVLVLATTTNTGSTNAATINAANSGGLIMGGAETGNVGTAGQAIIGSSTANNILIGSQGNDSITGGTATDVIVTDGGADTINLGATHVTDRVEIYGVNNNATVQPLTSTSALQPQGATAASIVTVAGGVDDAQFGFWGLTAGSSPVNIFTLYPGTSGTTFGTSADMATVNHFISGTAGDTVDISVSSFTAASGTHKGLTAVDGKTAVVASTYANIVPIPSGGVLSGPTADLVVLTGTGSTFANANALAAALKSGTFALSLSAATQAGNVDHLLMAYNDTVGNTRIADVAINQATTTTGAFSSQTNVAAQDLVQLTGLSASSLTTNNLYFVG